MEIKQTKGTVVEKTNMKEPKYNFVEKQAGKNVVICGAELEATHFHITVDGYRTDLEIAIIVDYVQGKQKDIRLRRRLSNSFMETQVSSSSDFANQVRAPDTAKVGIELEIGAATEE